MHGHSNKNIKLILFQSDTILIKDFFFVIIFVTCSTYLKDCASLGTYSRTD